MQQVGIVHGKDQTHARHHFDHTSLRMRMDYLEEAYMNPTCL
jgi:hypothetical protein